MARLSLAQCVIVLRLAHFVPTALCLARHIPPQTTALLLDEEAVALLPTPGPGSPKALGRRQFENIPSSVCGWIENGEFRRFAGCNVPARKRQSLPRSRGWLGLVRVLAVEPRSNRMRLLENSFTVADGLQTCLWNTDISAVGPGFFTACSSSCDGPCPSEIFPWYAFLALHILLKSHTAPL